MIPNSNGTRRDRRTRLSSSITVIYKDGTTEKLLGYQYAISGANEPPFFRFYKGDETIIVPFSNVAKVETQF